MPRNLQIQQGPANDSYSSDTDEDSKESKDESNEEFPIEVVTEDFYSETVEIV